MTENKANCQNVGFSDDKDILIQEVIDKVRKKAGGWGGGVGSKDTVFLGLQGSYVGNQETLAILL